MNIVSNLGPRLQNAQFDITQLILLAPGRYRFQGKYEVDVVSQLSPVRRIPRCLGRGLNAR